MNEKFYLKTLGCKVNQYNSEFIRENLISLGWEEKEGGWAIINGCVVTKSAERKTRKEIYRALRKGEKVIVTGCFARYLPSFPGVVSIPEEDRVVEYLTGKKPLLKGIKEFPKHQRIWVKVQQGCPGGCSYCVVPRVRGKVYSRPEEEILEEIKVVEGNFREIVLTGTHLGVYGREWGGSLSSLVEKILKILKKARLRLSSLEIKEVDEHLLELFSSEKLCPHLHLPLQSGSTRILKLMNRPYTAEEFVKITENIRRKVKNIAFTTDIMIGFPPETQLDLEASIEMLNKVGFLRVHIFPFSPRKGTPAEKYKPLPPKVIRERFKIMEEAVIDSTYKERKKHLGKIKNVLIEEEGGGGYSEDYIWIKVKEGAGRLGEVLEVEITEVTKTETFGEVIHGKEMSSSHGVQLHSYK